MKNINKLYKTVLLAAFVFGSSSVFAQETPKEEDFFKIMKVATPEGIILEVGGLVNLPNGDASFGQVTQGPGGTFIGGFYSCFITKCSELFDEETASLA